MNHSQINSQTVLAGKQAIVLSWLAEVENSSLRSLMAIIGGVVGLNLLAQVAIPLPWTPVPITGQTFGVALIALLWGRRDGLAVFAGYLAWGIWGFPYWQPEKLA
jgi:biotin transport system substrate-specific component